MVALLAPVKDREERVVDHEGVGSGEYVRLGGRRVGRNGKGGRCVFMDTYQVGGSIRR